MPGFRCRSPQLLNLTLAGPHCPPLGGTGCISAPVSTAAGSKPQTGITTVLPFDLHLSQFISFGKFDEFPEGLRIQIFPNQWFPNFLTINFLD